MYGGLPPNRMGLGMRPGPGPSFAPPVMPQRPGLPPAPVLGGGPKVSLFVGSISPGITDEFLNQLLAVSIQIFCCSLL